MKFGELTQDQLKAILEYDPETGHFTWRVRRNQHAQVGDRAGTISLHGYRRINLGRKLYMAHRLAVFYMTGAWPEADTDHRRGDRDDNRWEKLRPLSRSENMQNLQGAHRDNKTGFLGVAASRDRYAAHIRYGGKNRYLGTFNTPEDAHAAYLKAKAINHPASTLTSGGDHAVATC
jgi:hypothetical protein